MHRLPNIRSVTSPTIPGCTDTINPLPHPTPNQPPANVTTLTKGNGLYNSGGGDARQGSNYLPTGVVYLCVCLYIYNNAALSPVPACVYGLGGFHHVGFQCGLLVYNFKIMPYDSGVNSMNEEVIKNY